MKQSMEENIMINNGRNSEGLHTKMRSLTPNYVNFFYGICFYCNNFGHKVVDCRAYKRNVQKINAYVSPHNIECYKCHNYVHISQKCRSMIVPTMKEEKT
jgi:hypothetical protein